MKETQSYDTIDSFKNDWYGTKELYDFLRSHDFAANLLTLLRWESLEIIPPPRRVQVRGHMWRAYSKDGADFQTILQYLRARAKNTIAGKLVSYQDKNV